jgi:hypothetical protein
MQPVPRSRHESGPLHDSIALKIKSIEGQHALKTGT